MLDRGQYIVVGIIGFWFLILGAINGGVEYIPVNMKMMPEILATSCAITGGITVMLFIVITVLEWQSCKTPYVYGEIRKEESLKTYDKEEFKENQKKWREHYSKLKAKRGL
ncbi:MAG: hypothetical protein RBT59_10115 [Arcobacteraceae bacterium]|jgi:hypothetical protein|nr:hypothetical protein [Arcobacteraceae bacterium]